MISRRSELLKQCESLETAYPLAFPWNAEPREVPRYHRDADGWWRDPAARNTGKALLACTGDLMCEPRMTRANQYGESMFFQPQFQFVRGILTAADFTIGNLETTVTDMTPYAGQYHTVAGKYHCNAPDSYLDALRYAGFDGFVNANNHNCDSGVAGMMDTNRRIDRHGFMRTGTFLPGETDRALLVEICGIRVGIVSYATFFNRLDQFWTEEGMKLLNAFTPEKAAADVRWARDHGAEFVLSYIHWGKSYVHEPTDVQREQAKALANAGVDCIVGSHSHCLQIEETVTASDGRRVSVIYSMGNFVTNETADLCRHCGVLQLLLEKTAEGIHLTRWFMPCLVMDEFGTGRFVCVPADVHHNGGYDDPELHRSRKFAFDLLPGLREPISGAVTLSEACRLWGVELPAGIADTGFSRVSAQAQRPAARALYFSAGGEDKFLCLQLRRHKPVAVVTETELEGQPCILVPDVKKAYLDLCTMIRSRLAAKTVVVTGNSKKTLVRSAVVHGLRSAGRVLTHEDDVGIDEFCCLHLHPSHDYCVQELRPGHAMGEANAIRALAPQVLVVTSDMEALPEMAAALNSGSVILYNACDKALAVKVNRLVTKAEIRPFEDIVCAAVETAVSLGVGKEQALAAMTDFSYDGFEENAFSVDGCTVLTDYACKTREEAEASARRLAACSGRRIAVVEAAYADLCTFADTVLPVETLPEDRDQRILALREREDLLLGEMTEGCTVLLCGRRELQLNVTLRRVFGLTDGQITDLW